MSSKPILVIIFCILLILIIVPISIDVIDVAPDNPLYFIKRFGEDIQEKFLGDANWHADRATERLREYSQMAKENKEKEYRTLLSDYLNQIHAVNAKKETAEEVVWKMEKNIQSLEEIWLTIEKRGFWKVPREAPVPDVIKASREVKSSIEKEFQDMSVTFSGSVLRFENEEIEAKLDRLVTDLNASTQIALLLTQENEQTKAYFLFSSENFSQKSVTSVIVQGKFHQLPEDLSAEFRYIDGLIFAEKIEELDPIVTLPLMINYLPEEYKFKLVEMNTTYLISTYSIHRRETNDHIGLGYVTDYLGAPYFSFEEWYLPVLDIYNTESRIWQSRVTGVVLSSGVKVQSVLQLALSQKFYRFEEIQETSEGPFLWPERMEINKGSFVPIEELLPNLDTVKYDRQILTTEGIALDGIINVNYGFPVSKAHFDRAMVGVVENESMMPLIALDKFKIENAGQLVFGRYSFELSIYTHIPTHYSTVTYPFIIDLEAKQDPIVPLSQAGFGDHVEAWLENYSIIQLPYVQISESLSLKEVNLLLPESNGPMILTKSELLTMGEKLGKIFVEGFLLDASVFKVPSEYIQRYGSSLIVCREIHEI